MPTPAPTRLVHTITGLTNGDSYTFTAVATNSVGAGDPSASSASITIGPNISVDSGQTGTLTAQQVVDLSAGSTLDVTGGVATVGSVLNLPQASVTVKLGGQTVTATAQSDGAQLGLGQATVNGQPTALLQLLSGSVNLTLPPDTPTLMVGGAALSTGSSGAQVIITLEADGSIDIIVISGALTVPCGSLCAARSASQVHAASITGPVTAQGGEMLHYSLQGVLTAWTLTTTGSGAGSQQSTAGLPANVTFVAPLYSLDGNLERLGGTSLLAAVTSTLSTVLGIPLQSMAASPAGCAHWSVSGLDIYAAPQGPITIDPNLATGLSLLDDGKVQVVESGVIVQLAPCVADLNGLAAALGSSAQLTMDGDLLRVALGGANFVAMPSWLLTTGSGKDFSADAQGNLIYIGSGGLQQTLYPAFGNHAQLATVLKAFDAKSTATVNLDASVSVTLAGGHYLFIPAYQAIPTPTAHVNDTWWIDGSLLYLNNQDGSAQAFTVH